MTRTTSHWEETISIRRGRVCLVLMALLLGLSQVSMGDDVVSAVETDIAEQAPEGDDAQEKNTTEESVSMNDFSSFNLILERNIFDPDRRGPRKREVKETKPKPPLKDSFTLLGTMSYEGKQFAFFGASDSSWAGAFKPGDSLADHTLAQIKFDRVILQWGDDTIDFAVGDARFRYGDTPWNTQNGLSAGSEDQALDSPADVSEVSKLEGNDLLKQLMERRKQELAK
ncbi:MAG: hypothetical protein P8L18_09065 [Verrucomicrobiota bacterium]|jgi:hypothetical protein|nr:hypothetical protein [Verrucomicrobiota bacterium]